MLTARISYLFELADVKYDNLFALPLRGEARSEKGDPKSFDGGLIHSCYRAMEEAHANINYIEKFFKNI